jgi:hypothetical protein
LSAPPNWTLSPPNLFDIVTGFYPESKPVAGTPALRPCLVTHVYQDTETGAYACEIVFGTKNLKILRRRDKDLIIQNFSDMQEMGLYVATRFDLDGNKRIVVEWSARNFKPWSGYRTPKIGRLTESYQKEYAWLMMTRMGI